MKQMCFTTYAMVCQAHCMYVWFTDKMHESSVSWCGKTSCLAADKLVSQGTAPVDCSSCLGQYPAYDAICDSVAVEAEQAVKRLRHHPSVVIFGQSNKQIHPSEC
jgi:hypothetical protein